jgi:hypothetical protein
VQLPAASSRSRQAQAGISRGFSPTDDALKHPLPLPNKYLGMIYPNVGFKDAILEALPGGNFLLKDPANMQPLCPIQFHNRKAARNWAHGRGLRLIENQTSAASAFPRPSA